MLDGANRAPHRLSRLVRPVGLLGIKLAQPRMDVRITVRLLVDDISTLMWDRHSHKLSGEPMPRDEGYVPSDETDRHRQVEVTAQGKPRGLALIALRPTDDKTVRQQLSFELSADEIGDSGLVMIGLEHPANAPAWARTNELQDSLVGMCVARVSFEPLEKRVAAHVSTGRPSYDGAQISPANPGYFMLNPAADASPTEVSVTPRGAGGERLLGRRAKVKHPLRYARERAEDRRAEAPAPAVIEVVDLAGDQVLETTVDETGGRHRFTVPGDVGPVFVRARKLVGGEPRSVNWGVRTGSTKS